MQILPLSNTTLIISWKIQLIQSVIPEVPPFDNPYARNVFWFISTLPSTFVEMFLWMPFVFLDTKRQTCPSFWITNTIKGVHRRATKCIDGLRSQPYCSRLQSANLPTLVFWHKRNDVMLTHRCLQQGDQKPFIFSPHQRQNTRTFQIAV